MLDFCDRNYPSMHSFQRKLPNFLLGFAIFSLILLIILSFDYI